VVFGRGWPHLTTGPRHGEACRVTGHMLVEFLRTGYLRHDSDSRKPREVILSSWLASAKNLSEPAKP
jgi:hypothetical protein